MSTTSTQKPEPDLTTRAGVNPRTGRPWTLADIEVRRELDAELEEMRQDPSKAMAFLVEAGILTPKGRLSKKYGGGGSR